MKLRLDKMLSNVGFGTRSEIKKELKTGCVTVNDEVCKSGATIINTDVDIVKYEGEEVTYFKYIYIMMNKPQGVISATEDYYKSKTVIDLLDDYYKRFEPFPVGRLDKDTEGMLILTNNGKMAHNMLSPRKHVDKIYYAKVDGKLTNDDVQKFSKGVRFKDDDYLTMPAKLEIISSDQISECRITIKEGKFHQIKRMFEAVDKKVVYLKRETCGPIRLDESLELGEYRELNENELNLLSDFIE